MAKTKSSTVPTRKSARVAGKPPGTTTAPPPAAPDDARARAEGLPPTQADRDFLAMFAAPPPGRKARFKIVPAPSEALSVGGDGGRGLTPDQVAFAQAKGLASPEELEALEGLLALGQDPRPSRLDEDKQSIAPVLVAPEPARAAVAPAEAKSLIAKLKIPSVRRDDAKKPAAKPAAPLAFAAAPTPANPPSTSGGGVRKTVEWTGMPSGKGNTTNKPPGDLVKEELLLTSPWHCAIPDCDTGLPWFKRDGANGIGRKVVSQYFGRNKKETSSIPLEVWHFMCRKHYQRTSYTFKTDGPKKIRETVKLVLEQLARLEIWRPGAKFRVQLTKTMHERMEFWDVCAKKYLGEKKIKEKFEEQFTPVLINKVGKERDDDSAEARFPRGLADEFVTRFEGNKKKYSQVRSMLQWVVSKGDAGSAVLDCVPPFEILIDMEGKNEMGVTDPNSNYEAWLSGTAAPTKADSDDQDTESKQEEKPKKKAPVKKPKKRSTPDSDDQQDNDFAPPPPKRIKKTAPTPSKSKKRPASNDDDNDQHEDPSPPAKRARSTTTTSPAPPFKPVQKTSTAAQPVKPVKKTRATSTAPEPVKKTKKRSAPTSDDEDEDVLGPATKKSKTSNPPPPSANQGRKRHNLDGRVLLPNSALNSDGNEESGLQKEKKKSSSTKLKLSNKKRAKTE